VAEVLLDKVEKRFGEVRAVAGIDLTIKDQEFVILVGPSGCGKTTTLRMIAGLEELTSGDIRIGQKSVAHVAPRDRDIAMVFQSYALYPHMTVYRNMAFSLQLRGMKKKDIDARVNEVAAILGLVDHLERKPRQLSGGQRQRVAVGAALCRQAGVLLFDEPLSNLDAKLRVHMRTELKRLHHTVPSTMIYVTHDQIEAMTMGDRIVIMDKGVIMQVGTPIEVYDQPANRFVAGFIGSPPMNFFPAELALEGGAASVVLHCGLGGGLRLPLQRMDVPGPTGRKVTFGIRPEHIAVAATGRGCPARVPATIEIVEPLGHDVIVSARCAAGPFQLNAEIHDGITRLQERDLYFDMARAYLFDAETECVI
jgi:multiple sugar transport system ATP-binding protein